MFAVRGEVLLITGLKIPDIRPQRTYSPDSETDHRTA